ncbi:MULTISPECIES: Gfo/Idh/MocA family oxidoreductase [unclassified Actinomyces]|uniref:Gfo/Idh/MocA family protein n=1 Tax=unclassified Actinomyces TaxID=2609248 RepID=UPI002017538E|nr:MULTISPECIES: Gfo/Idh/MocA family oxidoreductase [unclassified Actinomyces]MCL3776752.1 Gfo/Idh/MocA family oxidoreductase [Actinomyces sp. AC-20-1]MCL3789706.1 Gfo/Idh/MocA family oxidoreductase [Actinomyces sp. 187325]MCL3791891.1 Gfo/Idh/MocA family oxidoreductase [Actinomyces sp. 186855]MCL3794448.1 Gfo/Idh/MocA family oxidoreductase [Actinomyces sp. 217892]
MARTDAPGTRTTDLLPDLPEAFREALDAVGASFDLATEVPEPQDAPELRWGILGAGTIAGTFATDVPHLSSGVIAAVGSRDRDRAQAFIDAHPATAKGGAARAHGSYEELVADDEVEAVYVATPHAFHAEHALLALEAGKPVLVEKPFTVNTAQARRVLEAARERGLFAMEAMWTRFLPGHRLAQRLVTSGALGEVRHVRADHFQSLLHVERMVSPALAGGALLDLGVYPLSFIHAMVGAPPSQSVIGRLSPDGLDLEEVSAMGYEGFIAVASSGMDAAGQNMAEVIGSEARLTIDPWFYCPTPVSLSRRGADGDVTATWDASVPGGFQLEAAEAARCVKGGLTQSRVMPWEATLAVMAMMDEVRAALGVVYPGE